MRALCLSFCSILLCCSMLHADAMNDAAKERLARRLLNSQGCKACHAFESASTDFAPGLVESSKTLDRTELTRSLVSPDHQHGGGIIPDFSHLKAEEIDALVSFLLSLRPENE